MTYRELQKALKQLRDSGLDVACKLNSSKQILEAEYDRLTATADDDTVSENENNSQSTEEIFQTIMIENDLAENYSEYDAYWEDSTLIFEKAVIKVWFKDSLGVEHNFSILNHPGESISESLRRAFDTECLIAADDWSNYETGFRYHTESKEHSYGEVLLIHKTYYMTVRQKAFTVA